MSGVSDNVTPKDKWEFDSDVTNCFEDMLERSIPQYDVMRAAVTDLACKYVQYKTDIVDLGASRGDAIEPLVRKFGAYNRYFLIEKSQSMLEVCRNRFKGLIDINLANVMDMDLRTDFPCCNASVILSVLTLMFIPINYRQNILMKCYDSLVKDGALIIVEKVLGNSAKIDTMMIELYHNKKQQSGYTSESIERKAMSLEGVLVPLTTKWNEMLLHEAGFKYVDCFWRWMNFAGWIAIK